MQLISPETEKERIYLGIEGEQFSIDQLDTKILLIEIVGVYCPQCHIQAPRFNKLFYRIKKNKALNQKVKMLAIAAGANPMEVAYLKKESRTPFPVVEDPKFEIPKLLGEPRTPFTMLVAGDREVLYTHLGIIEDIDKFFRQIKKVSR